VLFKIVKAGMSKIRYNVFMTTNATFAGGCFWCVEHDLRAIPGVISAISGYAGGESTNPDYYNHNGHREAVQISYDSDQVSFKKLCQFFLDHIDPTDAGGQFYDRGESYKTAIYYSNESEKETAESLIKELQDSGLFPDETIAVQVLPWKNFYPAEAEHQDYADRNPAHYQAYAKGSGRVTFVAQTCAVRDQKKINWKE
jgi:methionine-S-sulfoxide reductase